MRLIDYMRLEVEDDPVGLVNLIKNPSGDKGSWGWQSPVANTVIISSGGAVAGLKMQTNATQASYYTTEFLPIAATQYAGGRLDFYGRYNANVRVKVRLEWYDAAKAILSSSTQSAAVTPGSGSTAVTYYIPATVAPTSTAYVKVRIDQYSLTSNPNSGESFYVGKAMLTKAASSAGLGTQRTNLFPNPGAENATHGFTTVDVYTTLSRSSTQKASGTYSLKLAYIDSGEYLDAGRVVTGISAGKTYTFQAKARSAGTGRYITIEAHWRNSGGGYLGSTSMPYNAFTDNSSGWTTVSVTGTAPAGATSVRMEVWVNNASEDHYFDEFMIEEASSVGSYFDGSFSDTGDLDYSWDGTAHASVSRVSTATTYDFVEPYQWVDILGSANEISVNTAALDAGSLVATILDEALSPATNDLVRPGKKIRLRVMDDDTGLWESRYEGTIIKGKVTGLVRKPGQSEAHPKVEITAANNARQLSNVKQPTGVGSIAELPALLEGNGVPWSVNGSGSQVAAYVKVAQNDDASLMDQVAITRDTELGFAWVDRTDVLQVWDRDEVSSTPVVELDETQYNPNLDIDWDSERCINQVTIKYVRWKSGVDAEEIVYGPYVDADSVALWGAKSAEFTIYGSTENPSAIAAYADLILDANATPVMKVQSLELPVTEPEHLTAERALLDLYDLVTVTSDDAAYSEDLRITGMSMAIRAGTRPGAQDAWINTLTFDTEGGVAMPTITPAPPTGSAGNPHSVRSRSGVGQTIPNNSSTTLNFNNSVVATGITWDGTNYRWTLPVTGRYMLSAAYTSSGNATGRRLIIGTYDGVDIPGARQGGTVGSTASMTVQFGVPFWGEAGKYVSVTCYQNSGGDLSALVDDTAAALTYLGP